MAKKAKTEEEVVEEMFNNLVEGDEENSDGTIEEITEEEIIEDTIEEIVEETLEEIQEEETDLEVEEEDIPEPRYSYNFSHPRKDLVFQPGTGGNFFATMLYDQVLTEYVGIFGYNEKINEYEVSQSMAHQVINGESRGNIASAIRKIPIRLEKMRDYIVKLQEVRGITDFNWLVDELTNILKIAHRLTIEDMKYIAFSDFLICKNDPNFTLKDEIELMGSLAVGEFYDSLHDLFYEHLNAHALPYMTDICHVPYHINTHKAKDKPVNNYSYAVILAHEQILYTTMLMKTKHLLRKKNIKDNDVDEIRLFMGQYLQSPIKTYQYITEHTLEEMYQTNAHSIYHANHFYYNNMIVNPSEERWAFFYEFFGYGTHYWKNKNRLLDKVYTYHEKNLELLSNFASKREINFMLNPLKRIREED